jgi:hypothetical protein
MRSLLLAGVNEEHGSHAYEVGDQMHDEYHLLTAGRDYFIVRHK